MHRTSRQQDPNPGSSCTGRAGKDPHRIPTRGLLRALGRSDVERSPGSMGPDQGSKGGKDPDRGFLRLGLPCALGRPDVARDPDRGLPSPDNESSRRRAPREQFSRIALSSRERAWGALLAHRTWAPPMGRSRALAGTGRRSDYGAWLSAMFRAHDGPAWRPGRVRVNDSNQSGGRAQRAPDWTRIR